MTRDEFPGFISKLIDDRPVRWSPRGSRSLIGYIGRVLQVFNADAKDQRALLDRIDSEVQELEYVVGGQIVVIFHSVKQSKTPRHHDFIASWAGKKDKKDKKGKE